MCKGQAGRTQNNSCTRVIGLNLSVESFTSPSGNSNNITVPVAGTCRAGAYPSTQFSCPNSDKSSKAGRPPPGPSNASTVKIDQLNLPTTHIK